MTDSVPPCLEFPDGATRTVTTSIVPVDTLSPGDEMPEAGEALLDQLKMQSVACQQLVDRLSAEIAKGDALSVAIAADRGRWEKASATCLHSVLERPQDFCAVDAATIAARSNHLLGWLRLAADMAAAGTAASFEDAVARLRSANSA